MVGGGLEERERRNGKAPIELGDEVITLSDSDAVQSKGDVKLKSAAVDLTSERQNPQVLVKELSRLLSIFPNASPRVAAADLASQLKKTSPQKALERIIGRYIEHGVPKEEQVPHEAPKPGMRLRIFCGLARSLSIMIIFFLSCEISRVFVLSRSSHIEST